MLLPDQGSTNVDVLNGTLSLWGMDALRVTLRSCITLLTEIDMYLLFGRDVTLYLVFLSCFREDFHCWYCVVDPMALSTWIKYKDFSKYSFAFFM